ISCNLSKDEDQRVMRRNLLLGIGGGLSGSLVSGDRAARGDPVHAPDLSKCSRGTDLNTKQPLDVDCCPPQSDEIADYMPTSQAKIRVRPAAHTAGEGYFRKYERGIALMKSLPSDDPRSFIQQAKVHCAYCNLTFPQPGDDKLKYQIHNSWLFLPFHRWYLYFYERILGKLLDDPTFGIPFWNWDSDNPAAVRIPEAYTSKNSPLYDSRRNPNHFPPAPADLSYSASARKSRSPEKIISHNQTIMYREMVRRVWRLQDFYGAKYVVGTKPDPGPGTVERGSHTAIHAWVGENTSTAEDMGNFYSAARDPIFYGHHANVDRLWCTWQDLRGSKKNYFNDSDWLDASFVFYDENARLVRVKVRDAVDIRRLGYAYQDVDSTWLKKRPLARFRKSDVAAKSNAPRPDKIFPLKLDKVVKVLVQRPKKSRSHDEKEREEELLVIEGIEVDKSKFVKFDVFVNDEEDDPDEFDKAEYAGSYSQVVQKKNSTRVNTKITLGLTEILEDLGAEDHDDILVALVPKVGGEDITIGGIKIIYDSE
ncbi:polyphenol oxidase, partial [Genlisea aurea]